MTGVSQGGCPYVTMGELVVLYGEPEGLAFGQSAVWLLYRYPDQLVAMASLGASEAWIQGHVIDRLEDSEIWYARTGDRAIRPSDIMQIHARLALGDSMRLDGVVTLVDQEVTSVCCLGTNEVLSEAEVLDEENADALRTLGDRYGVEPSSLLPVRYELLSAVGQQSIIPDRAGLEIPVCWARGGN